MTDYSEIRSKPPVGLMGLWRDGLSEPLPILSFNFYIDALTLTRDLLDDFEAREYRPVNSKLLNCIGLWFLMMESGISTVVKAISFTHDVSSLKKLPDKFAKIPEITSSSPCPTDLQKSELQEFCCFRNQTFHDLYYERKNTEYTKTHFSKVPAYANEIDMMEAIRIAVNSLNFYRYAIQGVSLIENNTDMIKVYQEELLPRFREIMNQKGYTSVIFRNLDAVQSQPLTPGTYTGVIKY
ncbi:MAG: hypothetical protein ACRBBJ_07085 [Rhodomicrobiaceae bacterium]